MSKWLVLLAVLVGTTWSSAAWADVPIPNGWQQGDRAAPEARARASEWASAWSAGLALICSTPDADDFAETLVVLDVGGPVPEEALARPDAAREWLEPRVRTLLGDTDFTLESVELEERPEPGVAIIVARIAQGDALLMLAVGPRGARHRAVLLTYSRSGEILYGGVFEASVAGMSDLHAPIFAFPRAILRWLAMLAWLAVGAIVGVGWTRRNLPLPGARVAGRQVGAVLVGCAALVMVISGVALGGSTAELALAGTTPWGFAVELAMGGVVAAVLVVLGTGAWDRRLRPVASAPQQGSFTMANAAARRASAAGDPRPSPVSAPMPQASPPSPPAPGGTQIGPAPGPTPVTTGQTQIGPAPTAPAVSGQTRVGPPPAPPRDDEVTVARPHPAAGLTDIDARVRPRIAGITQDTHPRYRRKIPGVTDITTGRARSGAEDGPASLVDAEEALREDEAPRASRVSPSDLFPRAEHERRPSSEDGHSALDAPLPTRDSSR